MMLKLQQAVCNKASLEYQSYHNQKSACKLFEKSSQDNLTFFICGKIRQKSYTCNSRNNSSKIKYVWIRKNTCLTNHKRPKIIWTPKST